MFWLEIIGQVFLFCWRLIRKAKNMLIIGRGMLICGWSSGGVVGSVVGLSSVVGYHSVGWVCSWVFSAVLDFVGVVLIADTREGASFSAAGLAALLDFFASKLSLADDASEVSLAFSVASVTSPSWRENVVDRRAIKISFSALFGAILADTSEAIPWLSTYVIETAFFFCCSAHFQVSSFALFVALVSRCAGPWFGLLVSGSIADQVGVGEGQDSQQEQHNCQFHVDLNYMLRCNISYLNYSHLSFHHNIKIKKT